MSYKGSKCIDCGVEITTDGAGHRPVDKGFFLPIFEGPLCPDCWRRDVDRRFDLHEQSQSSEFNEKGEGGDYVQPYYPDVQKKCR